LETSDWSLQVFLGSIFAGIGGLVFYMLQGVLDNVKGRVFYIIPIFLWVAAFLSCCWQSKITIKFCKSARVVEYFRRSTLFCFCCWHRSVVDYVDIRGVEMVAAGGTVNRRVLYRIMLITAQSQLELESTSIDAEGKLLGWRQYLHTLGIQV
jgi:hypothetical protein